MSRLLTRSIVQQGANMNRPPTDISLSANSIAENNAINDIIGAFSTVDPDNGNTFTYSLVSGTGSNDNASFNISGANLRAGIAFNYEVKSSYSIRVRSTDQGGKYFEKVFSISITNVVEAPTNFTSSFTVDTILGQLNWTDNEGGAAQYEIYSNTNGAGDVLLATTAAGATSYQDTTCKQNASVVYRIRAKNGSNYSDYVAATALVTPLCWKTNQSTLTAVVINTLSITAGKSVTINWGDGTSQAYSGSNTDVTKNYGATGQYNIWLTGDTNFIVSFRHNNQSKSYGVITNWNLPTTLTQLSFFSTGFTGVITNWILPPNIVSMYINTTGLTGVVSDWILPASTREFNAGATNITGSLPQITQHSTNPMSYTINAANISDSNVTVFRKAMTVFNVSNQGVVFSTANIDKLLKALADWYEVNAPTANCTFTMNGANMGVPTGGASNADITRLVGYYTAAGRTATVIVRTS